MHELSIATNIVEIANTYISKEDAEVVKEIEIEIGTLSGVVIDALEFALEIASKSTVLENATIKIIKIEAQAECVKCKNKFIVEDYFTPCPNCQSFESTILKGKELKVKSLLVD